MISDKLQRDTLINGQNTLAVANEDGLIYRIAPIPQLKRITFSALLPNEPETYDLSQYIDKSYQVIAFHPSYNALPNESFNEDTINERLINYKIKLIIIDEIGAPQVILCAFPSQTPTYDGIVLTPDSTLTLISNQNLRGLHFICKPIIREQTVYLPTKKYIESLQPEPAI